MIWVYCDKKQLKFGIVKILPVKIIGNDSTNENTSMFTGLNVSTNLNLYFFLKSLFPIHIVPHCHKSDDLNE